MFISNKLYYSVIFVGNNSFECIIVHSLIVLVNFVFVYCIVLPVTLVMF